MSWLIGAGINLVGSVMINLGTNVMKLGHNKRAMLEVPEAEKPPVTRFREWQVGTAVFITGNVANFVSFGYAAQSLLAALGSVQFVSNVFFASFVLKEKITMFVIVATCCIIGGCLLLVAFGNHSSDDYTVQQLLALYRAPAYIIYLVMMFVFVLGSYILYLHGKHVAGQKGREDSAWVAILPVSYSIFSALLGTQSVLFSKSLSVLLRTTFQGESQLGNWYTWVTLVCFLISAGFWVTRLNKGLHMFPAMIIVPLMQICWTLFSIVSGMIYFQEYVAFNPATAKHGPLNAIMFTLGVLIVFAGVFLLTKGASRQPASYEETDEKAQEQQLEMVNNPAFQADEGTGPKGTPTAPTFLPDVDVPQKDKISMDTLKFTSLAASTPHKGPRRTGMNNTLSPSRVLAHGESMGRSDREGQDGGSPMQSHAGGREDMGGTSSMMGTLKKGAKKLQHRLKSDWNVDPDNFKQIFGMGTAGYMPALSIYSMNTDLASSRRQRDALKGHNASITHALPSSRFYGGKDPDVEGGGLQETKSEDLDRASEPLIPGGPSSASELLRSMGSLPSSFTRQGLSQVRMAGPSASSYSSSGAPDPGTLRDLMSRTVKQMEDFSSRARSSVEASLSRYRDQKAVAAQYGPLDPPQGQLESVQEIEPGPLEIVPHMAQLDVLPAPDPLAPPAAGSVVVAGGFNTLQSELL